MRLDRTLFMAGLLALPFVASPSLTHAQTVRARAVLGGTPAAWRAAMGRPSPYQKGDSMGWATCPGTRIDQIAVTFENGRAQSIEGSPWTPRLSARTALAQARRFFPPNTRMRGTATGPLGRTPLYVSAQLGRVLRPADFDDCNGNPAPRGSFILTVSASATDGYWWHLHVGACNDG